MNKLYSLYILIIVSIGMFSVFQLSQFSKTSIEACNAGGVTYEFDNGRLDNIIVSSKWSCE